MQVNNATVKALIQGEKQFRVPIWQRQYTWQGRQHEQLWSDLMEQYERLLDNPDPGSLTGHFLGSFVLSPSDSTASGVNNFLVIDGQQRLTTLMLLLCAIRDELGETDKDAIDKFNDLYLMNKWQEGESLFRLQPTQQDRVSFQDRVLGKSNSDPHDSVSRAYGFFRDRVSQSKSERPAPDLETLTVALVERLTIVDITMEKGDNAHRVFQSLNGTGVDLSQADLLRNFIFMLLPTRSEHVYQHVWRPMEELIGVENLQGLARLDIQRHGRDVATDSVYAAHQRRLAPIAGDESAVESTVDDLAYQASLYNKLLNPDTENDPVLSAGLNRLARWGAQTSHPLLIIALDLREQGVLDTAAVISIVSYVESFLARRHLARIPTNALNKLFVQLIERLEIGPGLPESLHRELSRDRLYWPSDEQIRLAARSQPFFHIGRGPQRKMILERLERSYGHPEVVDFQASELQVEHIMPQTLNSEWRDHLSNLGQDPDVVHAELVHTLGNLTLTAFNGTLSNNPFERKREIYTASNLEMNKEVAESESWGRDEIFARADELAEQVAKIWPAPLAGILTPGEGFDWTRIDNAIEAIPAGRWSTYSVLAEIGGTGAQAVGNHIAAMSTESNAYRVLSWDGRVSESFRWADPGDERVVKDVLSAEGVVFNENERADEGSCLSASQLIALIESPDDEAIEEQLGYIEV